MKHLFLFSILLMVSLGNIIGQNNNMITVNIEGASSDNGKIYIGLYDSSDNWLSKRYVSSVEEISDGKCTTTWTNIPNGTYAISLYHDENNNQELDTGWFGIPTESIACSNGAVGRFGPPTWEDAKFEIKDKDINLTIKF